MNQAMIDMILPQSPPQPPRAAAREPAQRSESFDRCLESAAGKNEKPAAPGTREAQPKRETADESDARPEAEAKQKTETGNEAAPADTHKPHEKEMVVLEASEQLVAMLPEQKTIEVPVTFDTPGEQAVAIPVQVVDPAAEAPQVQPEAPAAQNAAQPVAVQQEGIQQAAIEPAQAAKAELASSQVETPEAEKQIAETAPETKPAAEQAQKSEEQAGRVQVNASRQDTAAPVAVTPAPAAAEQQAPADSNSGAAAQVDVEMRAASAPARSASASEPAPVAVDDSRVVGQIVRGASMMSSQGRTEVRVRLRPPELGTVHVQLTSNRGNMLEARIVTEREDVRALIERNLPELRQSLAGAGVHVGGFDVSTQDQNQAQHQQQARNGGGDFSLDAALKPDGDSARQAPRGTNRAGSASEIDYII